MAKNIDFTRYSDLIVILQETKDREIGNYIILKKYLEGLSSSYSRLVNTIQKFQYEYLPKSDKQAVTPKFSPKYDNEFSTEIGKAFHKLASSTLMEENGFRAILNKINGPIMSKLDSDLAQYDNDFNSILKNLKENLEAPKKIIKSYMAKHQKYFEAGDKVKELINAKKSANAIKKAKAEFIAAKKAAIAEYNELRISGAKYSGEVERLISAYEDLERNRSINMQLLLNLISTELLDDASTEFVQGKSFIVSELRSLSFENDNKLLTAELHTNPPISLSQDPEASDSFQLVKINPAICTIMKPELLFKHDYEEGRKAMRVKYNINGIGHELKAIQNEYVIILDEEVIKGEHFFKCKNINESIGLIPANALEEI